MALALGLQGEATGANGGLVHTQLVPFSCSLRVSLLHWVSSGIVDPRSSSPSTRGRGYPSTPRLDSPPPAGSSFPRSRDASGPHPTLPSPTPSAVPSAPLERRVAAGPRPRPRAPRERLRGRLSAGTRRRGPAGAKRAGPGRRGRGVGTAREGGLRRPGTRQSHCGSCVPPLPGREGWPGRGGRGGELGPRF